MNLLAIKNAVADLVERGRLGDQNALAIITGVRLRNEKGDPRARVAFRAMHDYINTHPTDGFPNPRIHGDEPMSPYVLHKSICTMHGELAKAEGNPEVFAKLSAFFIPNAHCIEEAYNFSHALADGPQITNNHILTTVNMVDPKDKPAMLAGVQLARHEDKLQQVLMHSPDRAKIPLIVGYIIKNAQNLQRYKRTNSRISSVYPIVGWELGE